MCVQSTIINSFSSQYQPSHQYNKLLGSLLLLLMLALGHGGFSSQAVYSLEARGRSDRLTQLQPSSQSFVADSAIVGVGNQLANGQYLYGQSPQPEQIGQTYTVLEVRDGKVIGAFYQPRSSFDCYYGNVEGDRLAVTIIDSYEQRSYPYSIALVSQSQTSSSNNIATEVGRIGLGGFYRINEVSANDKRILGVCQENYQ